MTSVDKTTCWYDLKTAPAEMIRGAKGELWPVLEKSDHYPYLKSLMMPFINQNTKILDIGCGAAELSRLYGQCEYTGADLPHIIENVAKKMHPDNKYVPFDVYDEQMDDSFISEANLIIMNAFIDVLEKPVIALQRILSKATGTVIIHRQSYHNDNNTHLSKHPSYGGTSYQSIINRSVFNNILEENDLEKLREYVLTYKHNQEYSTSILLRKV